MQCRLLREVDFYGPIRHTGEIVAVDCRDDEGRWCIMLGLGCWLRLVDGVDAEAVEASQASLTPPGHAGVSRGGSGVAASTTS